MDIKSHKKKPSHKKRLRNIFFMGVFLFAGILFGQETYYRLQISQKPLRSHDLFPFTINEGELPSSVADRLYKEGFIDSSWVFMRYAERSGDAELFQAGKFYLHKNISYPALAETLTKAAIDEISVTLREGLTNNEIDSELARLKLIERGEFLNCVESCNFSAFPFLPEDPEYREGFFFPDTYFVIPGQFNIEVFSKRLLKTFDQKTKSIFGTSKRNGWDILKMASIIEKESRNTEERPIVAGILWKRLENGWMLGADATTRYATGKKTEPLTTDDLSDPNKWNTRAVRGLPPGAICNPGLSSLRAAANPQESEYWYYLHSTDGKIHYAKTLEQHNKNKTDHL